MTRILSSSGGPVPGGGPKSSQAEFLQLDFSDGEVLDDDANVEDLPSHKGTASQLTIVALRFSTVSAIE